MLKEKLKNIGLTSAEINVYLAVLELGQSNIADLSKKSGIKRTTTYLVIESLRAKGMISMLKKRNKKFFYAEDPRKLKDNLQEQQRILDKTIPELLAIANFLEKKPKITYYEGFEGIKDVYRDTLHYPNMELLAWVSEMSFHEFEKEFFHYYVPERVKNKIWARVIAPDTPETLKFKQKDDKCLRTTKLINSADYPIKVEINLYGNCKIGVMAFEESMGLIIESPKIYTTLKSVFELSWQSIK